MKQILNLQSNYSAIENGYQLWIPLDCSISIPEDDPVRLLNAVAERMDYREIEAAYSRYGRIEYSPKILTKVIIYGYMRRIISSREIERACKENICFMYLLEGKKAPDHNTISRFRSNILLKGAGEKLRIQLIRMLIEAGMVDLKTVFIDGTKIEANANKYSFVWKKAQVKKMTKLNERIKAELPELLKKAGIRFYIRDTIQLRHLKKLMRQLKANVKKAGIKFAYGKEVIETLQERITGRYAAETILNRAGEVLVKANSMITRSRAERIIAEGVDADGNCPVEKVKIRTILTCRSRVGICAKCYGSNMATGEAVQVGEPVGIIAAQSIGEPGTQLTMRTFHTGGVAGGDITQGLPRVEELFEARRPKGMCIISEIDGVVELRNNKKKEEIVVLNPETGDSKVYLHTYGTELKKKPDGTHLQDGDMVQAGDQLTEGSINPHDLLKIKGVDAVQDYLLREVQRVYRLQGVEISDKHIEVLVRQMLKKVEIDDPGDSQLLQGTKIDALEFDEINRRLEAEGLKPAQCTQILLGITKASLATESFLSAASFQETTKVLTDAAIKGKLSSVS